MVVVITVPHGRCVLDAECRNCDKRAKETGEKLYKYLQQKGVESYLFTSTHYRFCMDLNRPQSRNVEWRKKVQEKINKLLNDGKYIYLYDIHSFPRYTDSFGKDTKIALLDIKPMHDKTVELYNVLKKIVQTVIINGSELNDIIYTNRNKNIYPILIEFNESKEYLKEYEVEKIIKELYNFCNEKEKENECNLM